MSSLRDMIISLNSFQHDRHGNLGFEGELNQIKATTLWEKFNKKNQDSEKIE